MGKRVAIIASRSELDNACKAMNIVLTATTRRMLG